MENKNEINLTDSTVTSELGDHLTTITVRQSALTESAVTNDSGLEMTPTVVNENNVTDPVITVSYTHLDVYKRQTLYA